MTAHLEQLDQPGPLAKGWQLVQERLQQDSRLNAIEIEMLRLVYFFGARSAVLALAPSCSRNSYRTIVTELARFDQENMPHAHRAEERAAAPEHTGQGEAPPA